METQENIINGCPHSNENIPVECPGLRDCDAFCMRKIWIKYIFSIQLTEPVVIDKRQYRL